MINLFVTISCRIKKYNFSRIAFECIKSSDPISKNEFIIPKIANLLIKNNFQKKDRDCEDEVSKICSVEEIQEDKQKNKKHILSSLINQLEDLEKLVKNTKKELMKYNEKGGIDNSASDEAILSTVSLTNTIQKLFK